LEQIASIPVEISRKRLLRRLGGSRNCTISARVKAQIQKAIREIRRRARPRAIYRVLPIKDVDGSVVLDGGTPLDSQRLADVLNPCGKAAVFLVTMGSDVDCLIHESMENRPHYGVVLDAAASVAAESAAQYVQDTIGTKLNGDEATTLRYSPGYCDWPLKEQKKLFKLLPYREIGVKLSEAALMSPRKSVSGVIGICPAKLAKTSGNACVNCTRRNCPYRRNA